MVERWLFEADYSADRTWELAEWCLGAGATEFSLHFVDIEGAPATQAERDRHLLQPFRVPDAVREQLTAWKGYPFVRPSPLWRLNSGSLELLKQILKDGLFTPPANQRTGWAEDPVFYREGELLLGVVSHEGEAIVRLTELDATEIAAFGYVTHERPNESWRPWNRPSRPAI